MLHTTPLFNHFQLSSNYDKRAQVLHTNKLTMKQNIYYQGPRVVNYGWLIAGLGFICYRQTDTGELYGLFTPGGKFIRHLTEEEVHELWYGNLPKLQKCNSATKVKAYYLVPDIK